MWFLLQLSIMLSVGMSPIFGVLVKLKRVSVKYVRSSWYMKIVYINTNAGLRANQHKIFIMCRKGKD